jgi:hypothetical protein
MTSPGSAADAGSRTADMARTTTSPVARSSSTRTPSGRARRRCADGGTLDRSVTLSPNQLEEARDLFESPLFDAVVEALRIEENCVHAQTLDRRSDHKFVQAAQFAWALEQALPSVSRWTRQIRELIAQGLDLDEQQDSLVLHENRRRASQIKASCRVSIDIVEKTFTSPRELEYRLQGHDVGAD